MGNADEDNDAAGAERDGCDGGDAIPARQGEETTGVGRTIEVGGAAADAVAMDGL